MFFSEGGGGEDITLGIQRYSSFVNYFLFTTDASPYTCHTNSINSPFMRVQDGTTAVMSSGRM